MVARRELFPAPLSWQTQVNPPAWEADEPDSSAVTWRDKLSSPQSKVLLAFGMGMVLGWIIKRNR
jgi:hypothetical protein